MGGRGSAAPCPAEEAWAVMEEEGVHHWVQNFLDQCRTGTDAELRLYCQGGQLKVNVSANLGPLGYKSAKHGYWGLQKVGPSQTRRRERRAAERAAAELAQAATEKLATVKVARGVASVKEVAAVEVAPAVKSAAEEVDAEEVAVKEAVPEKYGAGKAVVGKIEAEQAAVENRVVGKVGAGEIATEVEKTLADGDCVATTSQCGGRITCWNCNGEMSRAHQCEVKEEIVEEKSSILPLCHYCCHRGSGEYPVHYFMQCLCDDKKCTCMCYCTEAQIEHKHLHFPGGFGGMKPVAPGDRLRAKTVAEDRANSKPCTDSNCVKWWKDDNAKCK